MIHRAEEEKGRRGNHGDRTRLMAREEQHSLLFTRLERRMSPASASAGSQGGNGSSSSSNGKRNGTNYRYRTVNAQSEVDETLFGQPHRLATAARMRAERDVIEKPSPPNSKPVKKEFVRHITKDLIRDIM
jgi:hypothetical protein